jgi:hypothetical protein
MRTVLTFIFGVVVGVAGLVFGYWYLSTSTVGFQLDPVVKHTEQKPLAIQKPLELPIEVDIAAAESFIKTAFGLVKGQRFQSATFLTPSLRTTQAQKLIALVPSYNNFSGPKVAEALGQFAGRVSSIEFGREGSPVIYVQLPNWTHQREMFTGAEGIVISDDQNMKLVMELREVFLNQLKADEFGVMPYSNRVVRIWWD